MNADVMTPLEFLGSIVAGTLVIGSACVVIGVCIGKVVDWYYGADREP